MWFGWKSSFIELEWFDIVEGVVVEIEDELDERRFEFRSLV